ncbi:MAG: flagellar basal body rod protein FlgC [Candidatus Margulisiibacteriota bacterium]
MKKAVVLFLLLTLASPLLAQGLDDAFKISMSGIAVQKFRLRLIAENIANVATLKTETGLPYQKQYAVLQQHKFGVRVLRVEKSNEPFPMYPDGAVIQADDGGFVHWPNVNLPDEYVDLAFTEAMFEANVTAYKSAKAMYQQTLEILK